MPGKARILVVDDQGFIRVGARSVVSTNPQWALCGEAANGKEAVEKVQELKPDLVILDMSMPAMDGLEVTREIRLAPGTKIIILTIHDASPVEVAARLVGADADVSKTEATIALVQAVEQLVDGPPSTVA